MRICLVGHHVKQPDEGVRMIVRCLARELTKRHEVMVLNISDVKAWLKIRAFCPNIIHCVLSPTLGGLAVAKLLSFSHRQAATVVSAPHADLAGLGRWASLLLPDLVLVQAYESETRFGKLGCATQFLPNGVDSERFIPVSRDAKERLRSKYNIDREKFVLLHVASMKRGRNLQLMATMQREDNQVLIVGRPSEKRDLQLTEHLRKRGCMVWTEYFDHLEEVYALSDCYVFPTTDRRYCIEMPLSVLEAMSCNLPLITTRFGALPRAFEEGAGFIFIDREDDLSSRLDEVKGGLETRTREKVLPYAWHNVVSCLEGIYGEILDARRNVRARS